MGKYKQLHDSMRLTAAILWCIATIFIIMMFVSFLRKKKHFKKMARAPLILSITIFVFLIIAGINFSYVNLMRSDMTVPFVGICSQIGISCLIMEFVLIECVYIKRLSIVFSGSVFDYPKWFYILMYTMVIMTVLTVVIGQVLGVLIVRGIGLLFYIFSCIFLTYLFIYSLRKVLHSTSDQHLRSDPKDPTSPIQIMIKFIILLLLSTVTSSLFAVALLFDTLGSHMVFHGLVWNLQSIDSSMNIISIYFQFKFFEQRYFTFFGRFHNWIGVTCFNQLNASEIKLENMVQSNSDEFSSGNTVNTTTVDVVSAKI
eukprot:297995_1